MEQKELLSKAAYILGLAHGRSKTGDTEGAQTALVKLRELLDAQPELEAGGG